MIGMSRRVIVLLAALAVGLGASALSAAPHPDDPLEGFNRKVYSFNDTLDQAFLTPVTNGYRAVAPEFVETGVSNFFSNISDIGNAVNNILQFKLVSAGSDIGRVLINSTFGILGLFDVASEVGLQKHDEDFGQTLGYWGIGPGPYLMLPLLGPSNLRDTPGKVLDILFWSATISGASSSEERAIIALNVVNTRSEYMDLEERVEDLSRDRYVFIRDAYQDRREFLVQDGKGSLDDELYEGLEDN